MIINQIGGGGGGIDINGVIEEYKCLSSNISAGDFVEYVNNPTGKFKSDTMENTCAVALSETKVFVAYGHPNYLYGVVVDINGTIITSGSIQQISSNSYAGHGLNVIKIDENRVFISHAYDSYYCLYAIVCTISGTTITAGKDTIIDGNGYIYSNTCVSATLISENKVFISYSYSSDYTLRAIVCTISGTTITAGTSKAIGNSGGGRYTSAVTLEENKVFIANSYNQIYLYGIVCTISGTTITAGSNTKILDTNGFANNALSAVALSESKVFITHAQNSNCQKLNAIVCTISGTTITAGNDTELGGICYFTSANKIDNDKVYIAYGRNAYLYDIICTISGTTITAGTVNLIDNSTSYCGNFITAVIVNKIPFIAHYYGYYVLRCEGIKKFESNISGVAKNGGTYGETIGVYVPESN